MSSAVAANAGIKKWWQVVSKYDNEEKAVFIGADGKSGLVRSKFEWRTVASLAREANLTKTRTEEIIDKYQSMGLIFQNPNDPEKFGYWEIVAADLPSQKKLTVSQQDQKDRKDGAIKKKP